jgi:hypothetical protein
MTLNFYSAYNFFIHCQPFFFFLQPLMKEYRDYGTTIDKVNDLGNIYDGLLRGERPESPARRRSSAYSPTKRTSVTSSPCELIIIECNHLYIFILCTNWTMILREALKLIKMPIVINTVRNTLGLLTDHNHMKWGDSDKYRVSWEWFLVSYFSTCVTGNYRYLFCRSVIINIAVLVKIAESIILYICILSHIIISLSLAWFRLCVARQCLKHLIVFFNTCHFIKSLKHYMFWPELAILRC